MQGLAQGCLMDVGEILEVTLDKTRAVFLEVALRNYFQDDGTEAGKPLEALVRWCPGYHGPSFGDWWVPDAGLDVLCVFPGVGPSGVAGDDLDNGYAFAVVSSVPEPPVEFGIGTAGGGQAKLGADRRVYKGRPATAHDEHYQGNVDVKIDGSATRKITGTDFEENASTFFRSVLGSVGTWLGAAKMRFEAATELLLKGETKAELLGDVSTKVEGKVILELLSDNVVRINGTAVTDVLAALVNAGQTGSAFLGLLNDLALAVYNTHTHDGGAVPDQLMIVGTHSTLHLKGN